MVTWRRETDCDTRTGFTKELSRSPWVAQIKLHNRQHGDVNLEAGKRFRLATPTWQVVLSLSYFLYGCLLWFETLSSNGRDLTKYFIDGSAN